MYKKREEKYSSQFFYFENALKSSIEYLASTTDPIIVSLVDSFVTAC
jgi:hypothetical protein